MSNPDDTTGAAVAAARIRILVVDDQALVRMGNALVLDSTDDFAVVGEAGSGDEAIRLAAALVPDVVLMDVRMPGMSGIEATRRIVEAQPAVKVIVLTTFDQDEYAFGALTAGASAFILKSTTPEFLVNAVRTVAAGEAVVEPRITRRLIDHFTGKTVVPPVEPVHNPIAAIAHTSQEPAERDLLTKREWEIFLAMADGLSNPEISAHFHLSQATVKTHVNRIFAKLQLRDRVHAVILAHNLGVAGQDY